MKSFLIRGVALSALIVTLLIILPNYVQAATITVEAFIDGRSQLIISGNTAQWQHFDASAPGIPQNPGENYPTIINSVNWIPTWSGDPSNCGGCPSSVFSGVCPGLSAVTQPVALNIIQARQSVTIIQQPSAGNSYTLIVEFNDNIPGGAAWYIIELNFPDATACASASVPTMTEWGMILFMTLAGLGAVYYLKRQKRV
jgi:hypothetical protein